MAELDQHFEENKDQFAFVTVKGRAGSGKSALVQSRKEAWEKAGSLFLLGTYEKKRAYEPYSGIADALSGLVELWQIQHNNKTNNDDPSIVAEALTRVLHSDGKVLQFIIPRLFQNGTQPTDGVSNFSQIDPLADYASRTGIAKLIRRNVIRLLSFLCDHSSRIVLVLDNLQWADNSTLDILKSIVASKSHLKGLYVVATIRDDEDDADTNNLSSHLKQIEDHGYTVHQFDIHDLSVVGVNMLLSKILNRDLEDTLELAEMVHRKTGGNPFFAIQFLQLLRDEEFVKYSFQSLKWEWTDVATIQSATNVSENVADVVAATMKRLPDETQCVLMVASCLGAVIPKKVLREFFAQTDDDPRWMDSSVDTALRFRRVDPDFLMDKIRSAAAVGILRKHPESSAYSWSHEKLQHAAYSMLPYELRSLLHMQLGKLLWNMSSQCPEEEWMVYLAADQMNRSIVDTKDDTMLIDLACLNLQAATLSISKSAFYPAADLLRAGAKNLDGLTCWEQHYDLCLQLYSSLAEMELLVGNHDAAMEAVDTVLLWGRTLDDKFRVRDVQLKAITNEQNRAYKNGVTLALDILKEYNVRLPRSPHKGYLYVERMKLKRALPGGKLENLLQLPYMTDRRALVVSRLLGHHLSRYSRLAGEPSLTSLAALRVLRMCCTHGICSEMTPAIALNATVTLLTERKYELACRYGDLALEISNRFPQVPGGHHAFIRVIAYSGLFPILRPLHKSLDPLFEGYQIGLRTGDTEYSMIAAMSYSFVYLCIGLPLGPLEPDLRSFSREAIQFGKVNALIVVFQMIRQTSLNLQNGGGSPTMLIGDAMDQEVVLATMEGHAREMTLRDISTFRLFLSVIYGNFDETAAMLEILETVGQKTDIHLIRRHLRLMYTGLAAFGLYRHKGEKRYKIMGKKVMTAVREQLNRGSMNVHCILLMLEAEQTPTISRYDDAIRACSRSGLVHHSAYMNERAGLFLTESKDDMQAEFYLSRALELYSEWGASGKVAQLKDRHECLRSHSRKSLGSSNLKGRSRYVKRDEAQLRKFSVKPEPSSRDAARAR